MLTGFGCRAEEAAKYWPTARAIPAAIRRWP
jgi:hypothetical protein